MAGAAPADEWPDRVDHWLNDFAGILSQSEREAIDAHLRDYEHATTNQVVVAIFPSLEGEDRDGLTNRLYERWKIGKKGKDNGVLLTVFVQDRKMRIEVGYGFESVLTDAVSSRILRDELAPSFREGRYADGINATLSKIEVVLGGGEVTSKEPRRGRRGGAGDLIRLLLLVAVVIIIIAAGGGPTLLGLLLGSAMTGGRRGWQGRGGWGGGGWGGGGGGGGFGGGGFSGGGGSSGGGGAGGSW